MQLCLTLCNPMDYTACQAPLSMGFSRQECWRGCHLLLQWIFLTQGLKTAPLASPASPALAGGFFTIEPLGSLLRPLGLTFTNVTIKWHLVVLRSEKIQRDHFAYSLPPGNDPKKIFLNLAGNETPQPIVTELSCSYEAIASSLSSDAHQSEKNRSLTLPSYHS